MLGSGSNVYCLVFDLRLVLCRLAAFEVSTVCGLGTVRSPSVGPDSPERSRSRDEDDPAGPATASDLEFVKRDSDTESASGPPDLLPHLADVAGPSLSGPRTRRPAPVCPLPVDLVVGAWMAISEPDKSDDPLEERSGDDAEVEDSEDRRAITSGSDSPEVQSATSQGPWAARHRAAAASAAIVEGVPVVDAEADPGVSVAGDVVAEVVPAEPERSGSLGPEGTPPDARESSESEEFDSETLAAAEGETDEDEVPSDDDEDEDEYDEV